MRLRIVLPVVIYHCPRARPFSTAATAILSRETMNTTLRKVTEFIILIDRISDFAVPLSFQFSHSRQLTTRL